MNSKSENVSGGKRRANWIAAGFIGAFAASVATVIYTGLMVEGSRGDFDANFRSLTLLVGETRAIALNFDVPGEFVDARLEVELPGMLESGDQAGSSLIVRSVDAGPGLVTYDIEVRAVAVGGGYLVARLLAEEPIALERVFVTVDIE